MSRSWFSSVFGFSESKDYEQNRSAVAFDSASCVLTCPDGGRLYVGPFECPSLGELCSKVAAHVTHGRSVDDSGGLQRQSGSVGDADDAAAQRCDEDKGGPLKEGENDECEEHRRQLLQELQGQAAPGAAVASPRPGGLVFGEVRGNVQDMHAMPENNGAVFMVASQVNCLEMVGPSVKPEAGITCYQNDHTQGPACAMAAPAATFYRNYLVNGTGQAGTNQINNFKDIEALLPKPFWRVENGYCLPLDSSSMPELSQLLAHSEELSASVSRALRVGVQWDTQVGSSDMANASQRVCQVFCSALPVSYCRVTRNLDDWERFATMVLTSAYESTLAVASLLSQQRGGQRVKVFLTRLGHGAFGNRTAWVHAAMDAACLKWAAQPLDVFVVKFR